MMADRAHSIHSAKGLLDTAESYRAEAARDLSREARAAMGQFMTPAPVAVFMASLFGPPPEEVVLLDPGAGVGSLTAAFIDDMLGRDKRPVAVRADAYELEPVMLGYLDCTLNACQVACAKDGVQFSGQVIRDDFIKRGTASLRDRGGLFDRHGPHYTHCIMNPPYKKISGDSAYRGWLRQIGVETSNLYSGFLAVAIRMLDRAGELVAIVPRSFCNGVYFKPFRDLLLSEMALKHMHVFDTRDQAFKDDLVLQENVILHAVRGVGQGTVVLTSSRDSSLEGMTRRDVPFDKVVKPGDAQRFIHIAVNDFDEIVVDRLAGLTCSLDDLGIDVRTGPVVDFRMTPSLRRQPEQGAFPLIYPGHFSDSYVTWPKLQGRKPNAIVETPESARWLMPNGWYVLTRRFSAKEEPRRIVAVIHDPGRVPGDKVGFENHVNVFHRQGGGVDSLLAKGLAVFLNSTLVDLYFRQFSGHTQVNATDLRSLRYPCLDTLRRLGRQVGEAFPRQEHVDAMLQGEMDEMVRHDRVRGDALQAERRIQESHSILESLGLPRGQRNERSALTLLALLGVTPGTPWADAGDPLMGITPIMDFARDHYGRTYAPNTRETFRRQTMHQFVQAGLAVSNPDCPDRPVNSPKWVYQVTRHAMELIRSFGSRNWHMMLSSYLATQESLATRYANERKMKLVPLALKDGKTLYLAPGEHSQLITDIVKEFGPRFAPGAEVLYVGDTGSKMQHLDSETFENLGLVFDKHGKFPDVVLFHGAKNWLLLVEAVTSHGPIDPKRHYELSTLFASAKSGLVFVTAFPNLLAVTRYLPEISWETEVWVADCPSHLIHFNGERFLGPHSKNRVS